MGTEGRMASMTSSCDPEQEETQTSRKICHGGNINFQIGEANNLQITDHINYVRDKAQEAVLS